MLQKAIYTPSGPEEGGMCLFFKKTVKLTATDTVFGIIKRYRKGVDVATLMKKTGFIRNKIYNNVKVLKKQGKIKSEQKGFYLKV